MNFQCPACTAKLLTLALTVAFTAAFSGCTDNTKAPTASAPVTAATPPAPHVNTYTTNFPLTENPMSEGGKWMEGKTVGIDWGNISTTPGLAIGTAGPKRFADATALLTGTWGPRRRQRQWFLRNPTSIIPKYRCVYDPLCLLITVPVTKSLIH